MARQSIRTPSPFRYRNGWRIQVTLANGQRPARTFEKYADAQAWANEQLANADCEHTPVLGGPTQATLAQALDYYARHCSVSKKGVAQELIRINQYLEATDLPLLKAHVNEDGGIDIRPLARSSIRPEFDAYVRKRRGERNGTFVFKHRLAVMKCSRISPADIVAFRAQMLKDGLSESTVQKEIALLKVLFNSALQLNWMGLSNPCDGIKLGKSRRRFVHLTTEQQEALMAALLECENPYFLPLVLTAKETTLRLDSLVKMTWANTSVENRNMLLPTKTGPRAFVLSRDVQAILARLPRSECGAVFPMSKSAINSAWDRVRAKCGLTQLQFRDLRHLGATDWVRRGLSAHQLKQVLGHSGVQTAQFYVDLVGKDLEDALDRASSNTGVLVMPDAAHDPKALQRARRTAAHVNQRLTDPGGKHTPATTDNNPLPQTSAQTVSAASESATPLDALIDSCPAQTRDNVIIFPRGGKRRVA